MDHNRRMLQELGPDQAVEVYRHIQAVAQLYDDVFRSTQGPALGVTLYLAVTGIARQWGVDYDAANFELWTQVNALGAGGERYPLDAFERPDFPGFLTVDREPDPVPPYAHFFRPALRLIY